MKDQAARKLHTKLDRNLNEVRSALGSPEDLIVKEMTGWRQFQAALLYMDGLTDPGIVQWTIQNFLYADSGFDSGPSGLFAESALRHVQRSVLSAGHVEMLETFGVLYDNLLSGGAILLLEDCAQGLAIEAKGWKDRNVSEPTTQNIVRGPMEGFNENIRTNTALVRRRIKDTGLRMEGRQIGDVTRTNVVVAYVDGLAERSLIDEIRRRLDRISIDGILESGYIEEFIQEKHYSPFPTVFNSERPDVVAAALLEGRAAILVDGTPFVLLAPGLFVQFFQSPEDYYQRADISSLIRLLRYVSFLIALLAPSIYIAVTTFHQEMLPTSLLINLTAQREGVPFPAFVEAVLMEVTFEILREAGIRMPKTVGQAVSIVGTLVIGQAAVEAGIVSAAMVIILSITAISSFVIPAVNLSISVRMIRFLLMALAASFGLIGILLGSMLLVLHLNTLRSFGVPYMQSFSPFVKANQKDTIIRLPWPSMLKRPLATGRRNLVRQKRTPASDE